MILRYEPSERLQRLGDLLDGYIVDARDAALAGEHDAAMLLTAAVDLVEMIKAEERRQHMSALHRAIAARPRPAGVRYFASPADHCARVDRWVAS